MIKGRPKKMKNMLDGLLGLAAGICCRGCVRSESRAQEALSEAQGSLPDKKTAGKLGQVVALTVSMPTGVTVALVDSRDAIAKVTATAICG